MPQPIQPLSNELLPDDAPCAIVATVANIGIVIPFPSGKEQNQEISIKNRALLSPFSNPSKSDATAIPSGMDTKQQANSSENRWQIVFGTLDCRDAALEDHAARFLDWSINRGRSKVTIDSYIASFRHFSWLKLEYFERDEFVEMCRQFAKQRGWKEDTTARNQISNILTFNRWMFDHSIVTVRHRQRTISRDIAVRELPSDEDFELLSDYFESRWQKTRNAKLSRMRHRDYLVLQILHQSGARISEVVALRCRDVGDEGRERSYVYVRGGKTDAANRMVPITDVLCRSIRDYIRRANLTPNDQLFDVTAKYFGIKLTDLAQRSGIPIHITPHLFRHWFIHRMIVAGTSSFELMARVGHADLQMIVYYFNQTRRLYPWLEVKENLPIPTSFRGQEPRPIRRESPGHSQRRSLSFDFSDEQLQQIQALIDAGILTSMSGKGETA